MHITYRAHSASGISHLIEKAVEVHVHALPGEGVKQDVLAVAVPQPQDVAHHGHDGDGAAVG